MYDHLSKLQPPLGAVLDPTDPVLFGYQHLWLLNEGSGSQINNYRGGLSGTVIRDAGEPAWATVAGGVVGVDLDGSGDYISFGQAFPFGNTDDFSLEFWVRPTSHGNRVIAYCGQFGQRGFYIQCDRDASNSFSFVSGMAGTAYGTGTAAGTFVDGNLYHVVITRSGTTVRIYLNGKEAAYSVQQAHQIDVATEDLVFGRYSASPGTFDFNGWIGGPIGIVNRALNPEEVELRYQDAFGPWNPRSLLSVIAASRVESVLTSLLFEPTRPTSRLPGPTGEAFNLNAASAQAVGLMGWWPALASRGTSTLRDLGPLKRNATLAAGATLSLSSERGWCLELDGVDDQVSAGNLTEYHGLSAFSITAWVRPNDVTTTGIFRAILSKRNLVDTNRACFLFDKDSTAPAQLRFGINIAGSWLQWTTSNLNLTAGVWQLVGVSYDTTNGPTFYKNGLPVSASQTSGATKPALATNNAPVVIGGVETYGAVEKPWQGGIDDPRTYSRALSAAEHWQMYDPASRWDLCQPLRRRAVILPYVLDTGGGSALTVSLSELLSLSEAKAFGASKGLTESLSLTDARSLGITRALAESLTLTDVRTLGIARVLSESLALTDTRSLGLERRLSEALSLADSVSASLFLGLALTLNLSEALIYTDSLVRGIGKGLTESWALTDSGSRGMGKGLSESISLSDARSLGIARVLAEALNLTDTRSLGQVLRLAESLSLADALSALIGQALAVTLSETLSLADQAALVAALFRAVLYFSGSVETELEYGGNFLNEIEFGGETEEYHG